jgi:hypothetical protein
MARFWREHPEYSLFDAVDMPIEFDGGNSNHDEKAAATLSAYALALMHLAAFNRSCKTRVRICPNDAPH